MRVEQRILQITVFCYITCVQFLFPLMHYKYFHWNFPSSQPLYQCQWRQEGGHQEWEMEMDTKSESWDVFRLRKSSIHNYFFAGALSAWNRGSDFTPVQGTKWEEERNVGRWKEGRRVGKKNGINKQIEEMEGTGMAVRKGQRKVHETMLQDIT